MYIVYIVYIYIVYMYIYTACLMFGVFFPAAALWFVQGMVGEVLPATSRLVI